MRGSPLKDRNQYPSSVKLKEKISIKIRENKKVLKIKV